MSQQAEHRATRQERRATPPAHLSLIDGLRGVAALSVVMLHYYHFFYRFPANQLDPAWWQREPGFAALQLFYVYGLYAVNIFWMISGFVFAHVYCGGGATTRSFVVNRIARLYPLHLLTLLVIAALQALAWARLGFWPIYGHNDPYHFVLHLTLASNWGLNHDAAFNAPIWSVSVEVAAYALFWGLHRWLDRAGALAALAIAALAGALLLRGSDNLIVACCFYFFIGSALALGWRAMTAARVGLLALLLIAAGAAALASGNAVWAQAIGIPGLFGGIILLLATLEARAGPRLRRAGAWIGDTTYGTYLWHVPMQVAVILALAGNSAAIMALASQWWFLGLWLAAVLVVARLSLTLYEQPMRRLIRRRFG